MIGMAKRGGPCGLTRGPLVKNAGRADLFNPLTRISPPRISPRPAQASSRAGLADPLTRKKKKWMKVFLRRHPMLLKWKNINNVFELMFMFTFNVLELGIFNVLEVEE